MDTSYIDGHEILADVQSKRRSSRRVVLTRAALSRFVLRFLEKKLTAAELQEFGDELEGEPVEYDDESGDRVIAQVLFEMSAPEINGDVDRVAAERWLEMLTR